MVSNSQKKNLQSVFPSNLKKLTITPPNPTSHFDFSDVFGPLTPHPNQSQSPSTSTSSSSSSAFVGDPLVIHNRSHSFVGPSPRYPSPLPSLSKSMKRNSKMKMRLLLRGKTRRGRVSNFDFWYVLSSEDQARVYTAEIVSAVPHLHKTGILHRYLKPENILMDCEGHFLKDIFVIQSKGHNKDADWWSVGILLYEMLTGQPPFTHKDRKKLQERIIKEKVKLPPYLSIEAYSLLKGLLQKEPSRRLGSGPGGGDAVKGHKWFRSINWKKLDARELQPKFKPDVSGKDCTANFDQCWTTMPPDDSPAATPTAGGHFQGYTYIAPNPWLSSR
ncbi:serine/threonine-protein kinase AtPK2/AtPK19 [Hevea brasiliensis]|uniref:serine/threonine-protein kinase AtPK2/AtPK19 n=1 Tax=Hevea brasiliensis TaxID=3981 RepID=UPI0025EF0E6D|nr:serine/threonine-protein kinase AtPK2/AtPK19 [Hevea brasiliensis]